MRFQLNGPIGEGRIVEFDQETMLVKEARLLKKVTGLGLRQFGQGMKDGDVDALMGMIYLAMRRQGVAIQWRTLDDFNINDLEALPDDEAEAKALEDARADATGGDVVDGEVVAPQYGDDDPAARGEGAEVTELRPTVPDPDPPAARRTPRRRAAAR